MKETNPITRRKLLVTTGAVGSLGVFAGFVSGKLGEQKSTEKRDRPELKIINRRKKSISCDLRITNRSNGEEIVRSLVLDEHIVNSQQKSKIPELPSGEGNYTIEVNLDGGEQNKRTLPLARKEKRAQIIITVTKSNIRIGKQMA